MHWPPWRGGRSGAGRPAGGCPVGSGVETTDDIPSVIRRTDIDAIVLATPAITTANRAAGARSRQDLLWKSRWHVVERCPPPGESAARKQRILRLAHVLEYHPPRPCFGGGSNPAGWAGCACCTRAGSTSVGYARRGCAVECRATRFCLMLRRYGGLPGEVSASPLLAWDAARRFRHPLLRFAGGGCARLCRHSTDQGAAVWWWGPRCRGVRRCAAAGARTYVVRPGRLSSAFPRCSRSIPHEVLSPDERSRLECAAFSTHRSRRAPLTDGPKAPASDGGA